MERDPNEMVRCYRVALEGEPGFLILLDDSLDALENDLRAHEEGAVFQVVITKMSRADLEALPEFGGWG